MRNVVRCVESARGLRNGIRELTKMVDPFSTEDATEGQGSKQNFIGTVIDSSVDTDRENFQSEYDQDIDILYEVKPLTVYDKNMYELGVNVRSSKYSKWMVFLAHLEDIYGSLDEQGIDSLEDLTEFLEGKTFEFKDVVFSDGESITFPTTGEEIDLGRVGGDDNETNPMMVPIREVEQDEIDGLDESETDSDDVEEVEL